MKTKIITLLVILAAFTGFTAAQNSVNIDTQVIKTEPVPLETSEYADIWVEFRNTGSATARELEVNYTPTYPFSTDPDEKTTWNFGEAVPGQEYQAHLKVKVDENAVQGNNTLEFKVSTGNGNTITHKAPVEVRSDNNILSVESVELPENAVPGSSHEMKIELKNLADSSLKNVQVSLDLADTPVAAETSATTVTGIEPGENTSVSFNLDVDESAENGVHRIPLTLEYENEAGTQFERETTTGLRIGGSPQLEAGINEIDRLTPGTPSTFTLRVVNRGFGTARFVDAELLETENLEVLSTPEIYIGNMDSDDYQTAEYTVRATGETGKLELPVELSYRDLNGELVTEETTVETRLYTAQEVRSIEGSGGNILVYAVIVLVLAVGGAYYWKKRRG